VTGCDLYNDNTEAGSRAISQERSEYARTAIAKIQIQPKDLDRFFSDIRARLDGLMFSVDGAKRSGSRSCFGGTPSSAGFTERKAA
jgi:hypothetical protein